MRRIAQSLASERDSRVKLARVTLKVRREVLTKPWLIPIGVLTLIWTAACDSRVSGQSDEAGSGGQATSGGAAQGGSGNPGGKAGSATGGTSSAGSGATGGNVAMAGSSNGGSVASAGSSGNVMCTNDTDVKNGRSTWYEIAGPAGACGYPYASFQYYGAMNEADYRAASACGTCVRVSALGKTLDIRIIDLCPYQGNETWCWEGSHHIDLSPDAFAYFAPKEQGVIDPIQWQYVPCTVSGGIDYSFKAESSQYWAEVLLANFPYEITKLEFQAGGSFSAVQRMDYNWFQASNGMGPGPYTFRVTDIHGNSITQAGVPLMPGGTFNGSENLPLCQQ
jgi:hypothetical protein